MARKPGYSQVPIGDLKPSGFPDDLDWGGDPLKCLQKLHDFVLDECSASIDWYYRKKKIKSRLGFMLRLVAILAAGAAGIVTILASHVKQLEPVWATGLLALAALLISIDRFGGYTSGWVRYVRTAQNLVILQGEFRLAWEEQRRLLSSIPPEPVQIEKSILLCRSFLEQVYEKIRHETDLWAQEFEQALANAAPTSPEKPAAQKRNPAD